MHGMPGGAGGGGGEDDSSSHKGLEVWRSGGHRLEVASFLKDE